MSPFTGGGCEHPISLIKNMPLASNSGSSPIFKNPMLNSLPSQMQYLSLASDLSTAKALTKQVPTREPKFLYYQPVRANLINYDDDKSVFFQNNTAAHVVGISLQWH